MLRKQVWGLRLLLLSDSMTSASLRSLLGCDLPANWEVIEAHDLEHARFLQQWDPCDLVLVDCSQPGEANCADVGSLAMGQQASVVVLSDEEPPEPCGATEHWLPRRLVLENPRLLEVVLQQAAQVCAQCQLLRQREEALLGSRRQVNRLTDLLWQTVPAHTLAPWWTQRQMIERLREEVMRSQRYGDPVSVVLGELTDGPEQPVDALEPSEVADWMSRLLAKHKRFCDMAGQYGPRGFLMLLPRTGEQEASQCCRRLRTLLESTSELPDRAKAPPRIHFGIASFSPSLATVTKLLARAEERLEQDRQQTTECLAS